MTTTAQLKETPLASSHRQLGARMVDFAGWNMPVQYKSIVSEHLAVRTKIGLFDVSHMGEFLVSGVQAHDFLQYVIANDMNKLSAPNMALYTQFVMDSGGTVDDLIVYRRSNDYLLVVNASNIAKDWLWLKEHSQRFQNIRLHDISEQIALLALQGPFAQALLTKLLGSWIEQLPSFSLSNAQLNNIEVSFGRTGYTGEDGFEIFVASDQAVKIWDCLLEAGAAWGIEPCGLGARDTLRLEAGLPLYGHELDEHTSPLEAGLGWSVKLEKGEFLGSQILQQQKQKGLAKQLVCLKAEGKALPRQGYAVYADNQKIGEVTSGSQGIFLGYPIAFAFVPPEYSHIGKKLSIGIRDSKVSAEIVKRPFYKRSH